ncbi:MULTISPECIES: hypothetical protein [Sphaerochaeta]|uniref:FeoB-associated Cys-rich membrane protein n=1 Tax=Sphaerochaeta associata TaxID=1129264 RepID=A0ABY4DA67_9SPIR|nr:MULTISPECIES: hypothetical protein [Sphaerochaeta]MDT3358705.1 hypothetical protein [Spirochaetota bacterium]NLA98507.1 hypothetical protein [Spirochaetales bacterium]MDD2394253.1 hypothetical protein [Sphaerochaeta sp.]MDD3423358.1 hypothetical protein [Sphaerochaeta sp.]MDD3455424.1 hypothetical protein [Sphaerochaeta sp.]
MINYVIGIGSALFLFSMLVKSIRRRRRIKAGKEMLRMCSGCCSSCPSSCST